MAQAFRIKLLSSSETQEKLDHPWQGASIYPPQYIKCTCVYCTYYAQHRISEDDFQYSCGTNGPCVEEYVKATVIAYTLKD
jgi:hypothetical protein